jgi:hypothetical protein
VNAFPGILLHVDLLNANGLIMAIRVLNHQMPIGTERSGVLRDLVTFRQVWVEVVLPGEVRFLVNGGLGGQSQTNGIFQRALIGFGERTGVA